MVNINQLNRRQAEFLVEVCEKYGCLVRQANPNIDPNAHVRLNELLYAMFNMIRRGDKSPSISNYLIAYDGEQPHNDFLGSVQNTGMLTRNVVNQIGKDIIYEPAVASGSPRFIIYLSDNGDPYPQCVGTGRTTQLAYINCIVSYLRIIAEKQLRTNIVDSTRL